MHTNASRKSGDTKMQLKNARTYLKTYKSTKKDCQRVIENLDAKPDSSEKAKIVIFITNALLFKFIGSNFYKSSLENANEGFHQKTFV